LREANAPVGIGPDSIVKMIAIGIKILIEHLS
jgi:hypothetical protein